MSMDARVVASALKRKGFEIDKRDHFYYLYRRLDGALSPVRTKISHGEKEIGTPLIAMMARQIRLSKSDFASFVECSLDREIYESKAFDPE